MCSKPAKLSLFNKVNDKLYSSQAVEILRNTDIAVRLRLERFLRGRKFEHLQVALIDTKESKPLSMPPSPSIATLTWVINVILC